MINKSKGLLALACMGLLTVGAGALAISNSASSGKTVKVQQAAAATRVDSTITIPEDVSKAGNAVYLAISNSWNYDNDWTYQNNWESSSAKFAIEFFNSDSTKKAWSSFITSNDYIGDDGVGHRIFQATVPGFPEGVTSWSYLQAFRFDPDASTASEGASWNRSGKHGIVASHNQIQVFGWGAATDWSNNDYGTSAAERIKFWASAADQWTSSNVCKDSSAGKGDTDTDALLTSWAATETSYSKIKGADVKDYFKHTEGEEGSSTKALDIIARYDWIYNRYHSTLNLDDFADRFVD